MIKQINSLDKRKTTTFNNIPTEILVENSDIISPFITDIYESKSKSEFPNLLDIYLCVFVYVYRQPVYTPCHCVSLCQLGSVPCFHISCTTLFLCS